METKLLATALRYSCAGRSLHALGDGRSLLRLPRCHGDIVHDLGSVEYMSKERAE